MHKTRFETMRLLVGSLFCCLVGSAYAQQDYRCVIERVESAEASPSYKAAQKQLLGKEFTVERRTGLMAGALKNAYLTTPTVIDIGSRDNSYKVVNSLKLEQGAGRSTNAYLLTVMEFVDSARKPFLFAENYDAYFGTCTHF